MRAARGAVVSLKIGLERASHVAGLVLVAHGARMVMLDRIAGFVDEPVPHVRADVLIHGFVA